MKISINNKEIKKYSILEFNIDSKYQEHTKFNLVIELIEDIEVNYLDSILIDNENINIFNGNIYEYKLEEYGIEGYKLKLVAYGLTKKLDNIKNSRIFQDKNMTYKQIIEQIMSKYNFNYTVSKRLNKKINKIYLQNDITDYEFLIRILSDINESIYTSYKGLIIFGIDDYSTNTIKNYVKKSKTNIGLKYTIENVSILPLDKINNLYVISSKIYFKRGLMYSKITLSNDLKIKKIKSNIQGRFIEARIVELSSKNNIAKVKVDFSKKIEDKCKNKALISIATPYSKIMTGLYVKPELNDNVDVYFPSDDEDDMKVAFCINNDLSERYLNSDKRTYVSDNFSLLLDKGKFEISSNSMSIFTKNEFGLITSSSVVIESKNGFDLYASGINLIAKNTDIELNATKNILLKAIKIHNN